MPRSLLTNEDILRKLRFWEEYHHRRCREYFFNHGLLTLPFPYLFRTSALNKFRVAAINP